MLRNDRAGFTLIEISIAIVILTIAILGLAASTTRMLEPTGTAENEFVAMQHVEDRLSEIRLDPRYGVLDSLYGGTETHLAGMDSASTRVTSLSRTLTSVGGGKLIDFWTVEVTVSANRLPTPVSRTLVIAAP